MASQSLYPERQGGLTSLVKEGERAKEYSVHLTHRYVNSPHTDLGQIIPRSVKVPRSELAVIPAKAGSQDGDCGVETPQPRSGEGNGMTL